MPKEKAKIRYLATFFDSNYLPKAIVMYKSLSVHHKSFILYAFCFDDLSYDVISKLNIKNFIPIPLSEFELKALKKQLPTKQKYYEYYWTYKAHIIMKTMHIAKADIVAYIDCDFRFFSSPEVIFEEIENNDILIQPNNFSHEQVAQFIPVGYYCSCFESFRNNQNGLKVLRWWHKQCVKWCHASFENGKFADQKYLDNWRSQFKNVREITSIGANIAPWNLGKYDISGKNGEIYVNSHSLIYYHYHSFKMNLDDYSYIITGDRNNFYHISKEAIRHIYKPYIQELRSVIKDLKKIPAYNLYAKQNPKSNVHLVNPKSHATFSYFKKVA